MGTAMALQADLLPMDPENDTAATVTCFVCGSKVPVTEDGRLDAHVGRYGRSCRAGQDLIVTVPSFQVVSPAARVAEEPDPDGSRCDALAAALAVHHLVPSSNWCAGCGWTTGAEVGSPRREAFGQHLAEVALGVLGLPCTGFTED